MDTETLILRRKATIHQVTTMLATSGTRAIIKVSGHWYWWLAGGYYLEIGHFRSGDYGCYLVDSVFFLRSVLEVKRHQFGAVGDLVQYCDRMISMMVK